MREFEIVHFIQREDTGQFLNSDRLQCWVKNINSAKPFSIEELQELFILEGSRTQRLEIPVRFVPRIYKYEGLEELQPLVLYKDRHIVYIQQDIEGYPACDDTDNPVPYIAERAEWDGQRGTKRGYHLTSFFQPLSLQTITHEPPIISSSFLEIT